MERPPSLAALLSAHLWQQRELGLREVVLERPELLENLRARRNRNRAAVGSPAPPQARAPLKVSVPPSPRPALIPPRGMEGGAGREPVDPCGEELYSPPPSAGPAEETYSSWPQRKEYENLRAEALACVRCPLHRSRTQVVFSDGHPRARLMVVGEAPGEKEDQIGRAFVGPAGKLLDLLLATVGFDRSSTAYICNVLKCRPPGNRDPLPAEIEACTPYLRRQIQMVAPQSLLALGRFAGAFLAGAELPLNKLRGEVYSYEGVPVVVTYHPAALLRNPGLVRAAWEDLQLLRQVMDGR